MAVHVFDPKTEQSIVKIACRVEVEEVSQISFEVRSSFCHLCRVKLLVKSIVVRNLLRHRAPGGLASTDFFQSSKVVLLTDLRFPHPTLPGGLDVLDIITGVVATGLGAAAYATYRGHGVPALTTVTAIVAAAYAAAPRRTFPTAESVCGPVVGKVAVVTGATSGIGVVTAGVLFGKGAKVYIAARNPAKLEATKQDLLAKYGGEGAGEIHVLVCDLSDLKSVQSAANVFLKTESKLDILINNAGIRNHGSTQENPHQTGTRKSSWSMPCGTFPLDQVAPAGHSNSERPRGGSLEHGAPDAPHPELAATKG